MPQLVGGEIGTVTVVSVPTAKSTRKTGIPITSPITRALRALTSISLPWAQFIPTLQTIECQLRKW